MQQIIKLSFFLKAIDRDKDYTIYYGGRTPGA